MINVYMFNLYQNQRLTKDMITHEQLDKCKLAFWLCDKEDENYIYKFAVCDSFDALFYELLAYLKNFRDDAVILEEMILMQSFGPHVKVAVPAPANSFPIRRKV